MRKTFIILAAAAASLTPTIGMARAGEKTFRHEGLTYVYSTSLVRGREVISGHRYPGGAAFRLVVSGRRVTGTAGGVPVAFDTADARGAARGVELASR